MKLAFVSVNTMSKTVLKKSIVEPLTYPISTEGAIIGLITLSAHRDGRALVVVDCHLNKQSCSILVFLDDYTTPEEWSALIGFLFGGAYYAPNHGDRS